MTLKGLAKAFCIAIAIVALIIGAAIMFYDTSGTIAYDIHFGYERPLGQ